MKQINRSEVARFVIAGLASLALVPGYAVADGRIQASLVTPPVAFDAGSDPLLTGSNTHLNVPLCGGGMAEPEHGICVGPGEDSGRACRRAGECFAGGTCAPYSNDGVTAADEGSQKRLLPKRSTCSLVGSKLSFKVAFEGEGPDGKDFSAIDTDGNAAGGVCANNAAIACDKARDCGRARACVGGFNGAACDDDDDCFGGTCSGKLPDEHQPGGHCLSGDEYWVQALLYVGSNLDDGDGGDHQACAAGCLGSYNTAPASCRIGVCDGGTRDGLPCTGGNHALGGTCPGGGTCSLGSYAGDDTTPADSDEVVLELLPSMGIKMKVHCPFVVGLSVPFEVSRGMGKGSADLAVFNAFVPPTVPVTLQGCFVHDKAGTEGAAPAGQLVHALAFGILEPGDAPPSANHARCADRTMVIHEDAVRFHGLAGNQIALHTPVSPILGSIGLTTAKLQCTADDPCRRGRCCGGACIDADACP